MAAGPTYEPISTLTLAGGSAFAFTSIPQTYTDLVLVVNAVLNTSSTSVGMNFNSDTAGNYSYTRFEGSGTTATSDRASGVGFLALGYIVNSVSTTIMNIQNYSNTTTFKTVNSRYGNAANSTATAAGLWRSTAAITRIDVSIANSFVNPSYATLYGIAAA